MTVIDTFKVGFKVLRFGFVATRQVIRFIRRQRVVTFALFKQFVIAVFILFSAAYFWFVQHFEGINNEAGLKVYWYILAAAVVFYLLVWIFECIRESGWLFEWAGSGKGGSARWACEGTFRKYAVPLLRVLDRKGYLFFGHSTRRFDSHPRNVGVASDDHAVTFGMTGSGKSVYVLFNNLSRYPGNFVTTDFDLELARTTAPIRAKKGSTPRIYAPFADIQAADPLSPYLVNYNVVDEIPDINAPDAMSFVSAIAGACFISNKGENPYWNNNSQLMVEAGIVQAKSHPAKNLRTLADVADHLLGRYDTDQFIAEMSVNPACGGIAQRAAQLYLRASDTERGYLMNGIEQALKWTAHPRMRAHMACSDALLRDSLTENVSEYFSIPFERATQTGQIRYLRMMLDLKMLLMQKAKERPKIPVLFALDEFLSLGKMDKMLNNYRELRKYKIKCWIFAQDASSARVIYEDGWRVFTSNATVQVLGINCDVTAEWIAKRLGEYRVRQPNGMVRSVPLMNSSEVLLFLGKDAPNQIVIPSTGRPWQIKSVNWFKSIHSYRPKI